MRGAPRSRHAAGPGRARRRLVLGSAALLVAVLGAAVLVAGGSLGRVVAGADPAPVTVTSAPPTPAPVVPALAPVAPDAPAPDPAVLAAALAPLAGNPALGSFTGQVRDALSGTVLWESGPDVPQVPASTTKVLTAAAVLLGQDPEQQVRTRVLATGVPGQVVLVGGGDVALSAQPEGSPTYYPDAPRVDELVAQLRASGTAVGSVLVDGGLFTGPPLAPGWFEVDVAGGYAAPVQALMLDGARSDPLATDPPRSATPALDAGRVLAQRLGLDPAAVTAGAAPDGAVELASVGSAPLHTRAAAAVLTSDNLQAEALGRELALGRGGEPTFAGAATAVQDVLVENGFDVTGLSLADVSGLSVDDRVPARLLTEVLAAAARDDERGLRLRPLLGWLPVAGATGTLTDRYAGDPSRAGAGWVRAKTGTLTGVGSLAGVVTDADGRVLTFALMSTGTTADTRVPQDAIAALLRGCGCR